jgi:hypothetical protein
MKRRNQMIHNPTIDLSGADLSDIRDAVPALHLLAIRSLRRAGFKIVRKDQEDRHDDEPASRRSGWESSARSSSTAA